MHDRQLRTRHNHSMLTLPDSMLKMPCISAPGRSQAAFSDVSHLMVVASAVEVPDTPPESSKILRR